MINIKIVLACLLMAVSNFAISINDIVNNGTIRNQCVADNQGNCYQQGDKHYVTMDVNINNARQVCVADNQSKCYQGSNGIKYRWCDDYGCGD